MTLFLLFLGRLWAWLRRQLRRQWYRRIYLNSDHWRRFRAAWWANHPNAVCALCGGPSDGRRRLDLHHRTYRRIGHELFDDVVPLHRRCHRLVEANR